jgi:HAE1 family hydrophobic/amphiphilic exporter-1
MTIIVAAAGLYSGLNMKQETLPDLEIPILQLTTIYPGASPEEVVEQITKPIEQRVRNLKGVSAVSSTSMENASSIIIEYDYGQNMETAASEVREALEGISLPEGADLGNVARISLNSFPVVSLSVSDENRNLEELTRLIENEVKPELERLDGIADVQIAGQYIREVQLRFDKEKMNELGLNEDTVKGLVQASALRVPLGLFELGRSAKTIVVDGNVTTLEQLRQMEIPVIPSGAGASGGQSAAPQAGADPGMTDSEGMNGEGVATPDLANAGEGQAAAEAQTQLPGGAGAGAPAIPAIPTVQLQEIAEIELVGKAESISRTNGKESVSIQVVKGPEANTVDVVNQVKKAAEQFEQDYPGLELTIMLDQGKPIEDSVRTMLNKALYGALFAVIIILLFLRSIRPTIISVISIPMSLLIALLVLHRMDITLNMMTLGAMTVAIGRVIDDSIVVIENIYRRMSLSGEKLSGKALVLDATREMYIPILSSTVVTIVVFLPLSFVSGMVGELFLPFALTIVFALSASLLVAVSIVPMLGHSMFRNGLKGKKHREGGTGRLARFYQKALNWTLNHKWISFGGAVVLLAASLLLVPVVGVSFLPEQGEKYALITYSPEPGELQEEVEQKALEAEKVILSREGLINVQYSVGGGNPLNPGDSKSALFFVQYENDTENFDQEQKNLIEAIKAATGGGNWNTLDMMGGGLGSSSLELTVYGERLEDIQPVVDEIVKLIEADDSFENVKTSLSETYDQYTLVADQQKLSQLGLTAGQLAMKLSPVRERPVLTNVRVEGKEYKVYVEVDKKQYASIEEIEQETVQSPLGLEVAIGDVVKVEEGKTPNTITRRDDHMYATVSADVTVRNVGGASAKLQDKVSEIERPDGVRVHFGGVTEQINETFTQLGLAMAAAVAVVYLTLVITFGGGLAPFAILFSLPFAVIGGLFALYVAGETISVSALMGALMLIGIVVTNAIVLIDRVIRKEKEGLTTREALLEAGAVRLRPILMTALATIGALLPLALGYDDAGMISRGLGVTVIGGLASSTILTLFIVPIVYEVLTRFRKKQADEPI